jgi:hypothetical protein
MDLVVGVPGLIANLALARGPEVVQYTNQQDFSLVAFRRQA